MSKEFSMNINRDMLNTKVADNPKINDESMNGVMRLADDIMGVFEKNKTSMEDAYLTLISLADSIYMYSTLDNNL